MDWTQVITTFITTVGSVVSIYAATKARRHAREAEESIHPKRSGSEPDIRLDDRPRIKGRNDFLKTLDDIDDERDD